MSISGHITGITISGNKVTSAYYNGALVFETKIVTDDLYVTFTGNQPFTVSMPRKYWNGTIEYSTDGSTWTTWDCSAIVSNTTTNKMYFRGVGNTYVTGDTASSFDNGFVVNGNTDSSTFEFAVTGDLLNLVDYTVVATGGVPTCAANVFAFLFAKQPITSCSDLTLVSVPNYAYFKMFYNCTKLTTAPEIYGTIIGASGCQSMFYGCTALTETPSIMFESVGSYGANNMFCGCTSLTKINMTTQTIAVGGNGFNAAFKECTSLVDCSDLEFHITSLDGVATTQVNYVFSYLFSNCTSLEKAPFFYIHGGTATGTFSGAFYQCSALTEPGGVTVLDRGSSNAYMFNQMYLYCTSLTTLPKMVGVTFGLSNQCVSMFYGCKALKKIWSFNTLGGSQATVAVNFANNMFGGTGVIVVATAKYVTEYYLVVATVTTASSIYTFTTGGVTPITNVNTKYYTNAEEVIMVN